MSSWAADHGFIRSFSERLARVAEDCWTASRLDAIWNRARQRKLAGKIDWKPSTFDQILDNPLTDF
jgi:hypothetical protein